FRDDLLTKLSRAQARKVMVSLRSLLNDACRRGNLAQNVAVGVSIKFDSRSKTKLKIGVDIPTPEEIRRIVHAAAGRNSSLPHSRNFLWIAKLGVTRVALGRR